MESGTHFEASDAKRPSSYLTLGHLKWPLVYNDSFEIDKKQKKYDSHFYLINRLYGFKKKIRKTIHLK